MSISGASPHESDPTLQHNLEKLASGKVSEATHDVVAGKIVDKGSNSRVSALFPTSTVEEASIKTIREYQKHVFTNVAKASREKQESLLQKYEEISNQILENCQDPTLKSKLSPIMAGGSKALKLVRTAQKGIDDGYAPQRAACGAAGSYLIADKGGSACAIFKPVDEEVGAANSTYPAGFRRGIPPGEGAKREYVAGALDHGNFAGVPTVALAALASAAFGSQDQELKSGALIEFSPAVQMGALDVAQEKIDPSSVRRIAILDLRIWNTGRHMGNFLVVDNQTEDSKLPLYQHSLKPFDQSCAFSDTPDDLQENELAWMYLDATSQPFSAEEKEYIQQLDTKADASIMRGAGFSQVHIDQMALGTTLLQEGAKAGLTAFQLGELLTSKATDVPTIQSILLSAGAEADRVLNETLKAGGLLSGLAAEQRQDYRDAAFLKAATAQVRDLIGRSTP